MTDFLRRDLRYAVRGILRAPGFAILAILTMAIGVGANTSIFSIVHEVLLRPLPFADPDRLVLVEQSDRQTTQSFGDAMPANFLDWRERTHSFIGPAAYRSAGPTLA